MIDKNSRFLVVDDNVMARKLLLDILAELGCDAVDVATDGADALAKIDGALEGDRLYDAMFLDWSMPGMDGFEVLTRCRAKRELHGMAIVMVTADREQMSVIAALQAGATSYIVKPIERRAFKAKLDEIDLWRRKCEKIVYDGSLPLDTSLMR